MLLPLLCCLHLCLFLISGRFNFISLAFWGCTCSLRGVWQSSAGLLLKMGHWQHDQVGRVWACRPPGIPQGIRGFGCFTGDPGCPDLCIFSHGFVKFPGDVLSPGIHGRGGAGLVQNLRKDPCSASLSSERSPVPTCRVSFQDVDFPLLSDGDKDSLLAAVWEDWAWEPNCHPDDLSQPPSFDPQFRT